MTGTSDAPPVVIRVFGGMGLEVDGEPLGVGGPRQRRLLALLAIKVGEVVSVDWLSEYLWSDRDRPDTTVGSLRTYVSRLRQSFPEEARGWLETEQSGYRLAAPPEALEHRLFVTLRTRARAAREQGDPQAGQRLLDDALEMWRGDPFRELEDLDWAQASVERLRLDRLEMLEERWETALALGKHTQITGELAAFTSEQPLRERAARQYALALHRSGRTPEALRVIADHRRLLADGTGLDPSPAMAELEDALLSGDAGLDLAVEGRPLRGYRLLEQVGAGAFAVVWRGIQPSVDRQVAVKQIRAELASQPDFIRRFEAEAQLVARIEHPHVVPLIDYWRDPEAAYLVMRWLPGDTLERRLDDGPLTVEETLRIVEQVGGALGAAHAHDVVHRDVKSANVMFDDAGNAFLTDFGIALAIAESSGPEAALSIGSPAYAAPEQLRREPLGAAADVFSLGIVAFECLAGATPFADSTSGEELVERQLGEAPPSLTVLRPEVPSRVASAVARALAKDPGERFGSVAEFLAALAPPTMVSDEVQPVSEDNPYVGLRAFDGADADRFFGRRRLVTELVERLGAKDQRARALVVVGPSGSGKSSVVRAGLMPALRTGAVPGSDSWFSTTMVPGTDPYEALETALLRVAVNPPTSLVDQLRDGPRGILRGVRRCIAEDTDVLVLFIDQFEEVFVGRSGSVASRFLQALSVAVDDPSSPLRLVCTLRADYYHRPLEHLGFAPILKRCAVDVTPLAPDELEEAITEPASRAGVRFESGLVARIAAEAVGQASPLPMLQHVLAELFERRDGRLLTAEAYQALGGVSGALAARAESIYEGFGEPERAAMRRLFGAMTDAGEDRADLRRRVPVSDLGDDAVARGVLDRFGDARLVTFDRNPATREPTVEVAHEALLREWPRLVHWLDEDRDVLRSVDRLSSAATTWGEGGRQRSDLLRGGRLAQASDLVLEAAERLRPLDREFVGASQREDELQQVSERRRVQRLRRLNVAVSLALIVALVTGGIAIVQRNQAESATAAAEAATAEARDASSEARAAEAEAGSARLDAELSALISQSSALIGEDTDVSILLALEAHQRAPGAETRTAVLQALASAPGSVSTVALPEADALPCAAFDDPMVVSADGRTGFTAVDGRLLTVDLDTGAVDDHGAAPAPCIQWFGDEETDVRWVERRSAAAGTNLDGGSRVTFWRGTWDGPLIEIEVDSAEGLVLGSLVDDRLLMAGLGLEVLLVEPQSGDVVGAVNASLRLTTPGPTWAAGNEWAIDPVAQRAVVSRVGDGPTPLQWIGIVDTATGGELHSVVLSEPPTAVAIRDGLAFVGGLFDGITTVDVETGQILSEVSTSSVTGITAIGVRPDGLLIAVSNDTVKLVDREFGVIGEPVEIEVGSAVVRDDGTVVVIAPGQRAASIVEMQSTAIIERSIDGVGDSTIGFGAGSAAVVGQSGRVDIIDLSTGERETAQLQAGSERYRAVAAFPTPAGLVVFGAGGTVERWDSGTLVELVALANENRAQGFQPLDFLDVAPGPTHASASGAVVVFRGSGLEETVHLVDWGESLVARQVLVGVPTLTAAAARGGGVHVLNTEGLLRTYEAGGRWQAEVRTGIAFPLVAAVSDSGLVAVGGVDGGAIVDPDAETVTPLVGPGNVRGLRFSNDGSLLVGVGGDGAVHLWEAPSGAPIGRLATLPGAASYGAPWFDEARRTVWVATAGRLLELSLDPARWIERACEFVGRDLTADEWERYVPGGGQVRSACT